MIVDLTPQNVLTLITCMFLNLMIKNNYLKIGKNNRIKLLITTVIKMSHFKG